MTILDAKTGEKAKVAREYGLRLIEQGRAIPAEEAPKPAKAPRKEGRTKAEGR